MTDTPTRPVEALDGAVAVVTGAAGGLGRAIVRALAADGARIVLTDTSGAALADAAQQLPPEAFALVPGDVTDPSTARACAECALEMWGDLHILVNNAGVLHNRPLHLMEDEAFDRVIAVNLRGTFLQTREAARAMRERARREQADGTPHPRSIVNLASVNGIQSFSGGGNYAASKAGVIGLTRTAARELGAFNVRVNAVAPGIIRTPMTVPTADRDGLAADWVQRQIDGVPLQRMGEPDEVAEAVLFLASPRSSYVSGHVLIVDGGGLPGA